jgi:hypothetical protein
MPGMASGPAQQPVLHLWAFGIRMISSLAPLCLGAAPGKALTGLCLHRQRCPTLCHAVPAALQGNVRLMIDAEHTYFQPAIDNTVTVLQEKYNR